MRTYRMYFLVPEEEVLNVKREKFSKDRKLKQFVSMAIGTATKRPKIGDCFPFLARELAYCLLVTDVKIAGHVVKFEKQYVPATEEEKLMLEKALEEDIRELQEKFHV